jgi:hypothetical protein
MLSRKRRLRSMQFLSSTDFLPTGTRGMVSEITWSLSRMRTETADTTRMKSKVMYQSKDGKKENVLYVLEWLAAMCMLCIPSLRNQSDLRSLPET